MADWLQLLIAKPNHSLELVFTQIHQCKLLKYRHNFHLYWTSNRNLSNAWYYYAFFWYRLIINQASGHYSGMVCDINFQCAIGHIEALCILDASMNQFLHSCKTKWYIFCFTFCCWFSPLKQLARVMELPRVWLEMMHTAYWRQCWHFIKEVLSMCLLKSCSLVHRPHIYLLPRNSLVYKVKCPGPITSAVKSIARVVTHVLPVLCWVQIAFDCLIIPLHSSWSIDLQHGEKEGAISGSIILMVCNFTRIHTNSLLTGKTSFSQIKSLELEYKAWKLLQCSQKARKYDAKFVNSDSL